MVCIRFFYIHTHNFGHCANYIIDVHLLSYHTMLKNFLKKKINIYGWRTDTCFVLFETNSNFLVLSVLFFWIARKNKIHLRDRHEFVRSAICVGLNLLHFYFCVFGGFISQTWWSFQKIYDNLMVTPYVTQKKYEFYLRTLLKW